MNVYGNTSPRGYRYAGAGSQTGASIIVENVWGRYTTRTVPTISPTTTMDAVCALKHAIVDLRAWCIVQIEQSQLSDRSLEFIIDSINFAMTGKRVLPVMAWESLLTNVAGDMASAKSLRVKMFDSLHIPTIEELITEWVKQPNGISDLLKTSKILFGNLK